MQIVEKPAFQVVGIEITATWQELWEKMPAAWERFKERLEDIPHRDGEHFIDISLEIKQGRYRQLICAPVSRIGRIPDGMIALGIPTQRYIHYQHLGPTPDIAHSFGEIHAFAGEEELETDAFKLDIGYTVAGDETTHDLYVRLAPGGQISLLTGM